MHVKQRLRGIIRRRRSTLSTISTHSISNLSSPDRDTFSRDGSLTPDSLYAGPIEKGAKDGQGTYADDLVNSLRQGVTAGSRGRAGSKTKKSKKKRGGDGTKSGGDGHVSRAKGQKKAEPNWGLLEFLRPIFGPFVEPIAPLFSPMMIIGFLAFLLVVSWFRNSRARAVLRDPNASASNGLGKSPLDYLRGGGHHGFEQAWRTEEEALWNWLEQRVGLQGGMPENVGGKGEAVKKSNADASKQARKDRQKVLKSKLRGAGAEAVGMSKREIEYALKVTEEKLEALRKIVDPADDTP